MKDLETPETLDGFEPTWASNAGKFNVNEHYTALLEELLSQPKQTADTEWFTDQIDYIPDHDALEQY